MMKISAIAAVVTLLLAAGCSELDKPQQANVPESKSETTTAASKPTAPSVSSPLSLESYLATPCDLIEVAILKLTKVKQTPDTDDPKNTDCLVSGTPADGVALLRLKTAYSTLTREYLSYKDPLFEPFDINGMPAVRHSEKPSGERGRCTVAVGTDKTQGLSISYEPGQSTAGGNIDSCEVATKIAETAVSRLKN